MIRGLKAALTAVIVCFYAMATCSCAAENAVVTDDILPLMQENSAFEFYYRSEIAALKEKSQDYKVMYLSYDLNDDGLPEDICMLVTDDTYEAELDIFDTSGGANIGAKTKVNVNSGYKIQILKHKTKGYLDLKYIVLDKNGEIDDSVIMRMTVDGNSGYYTEAKK